MKSTLKTILLLLFTASFWMATVPTEKSADNPETIHGVSSEKIEEIFELYKSDENPGCAVSAFHEGKSVYKNAFGLSNLDYGIELSDSSAFYMASISKQVTAAAAGLLIVRGELDEDALVSEYIEEWPEYASDVKIGQLFNHTSGLPDIYGLMNISGMPVNNPMDVEDYMDVIRNGESLKFEPGTDYSYTNSGYTTLAYLIELVTEKSFPEFVDEEFFKPFGMESTHFHSDRLRVIPNRAISYQPGGSQFRRTYRGMFQGVGPGGLYSTLNDWEKWDSFWHGNLEWNDGISQEEAEELKAKMINPVQIDGESIEYGWGLHIKNWKGQEVIEHGGSFMGFKTNYQRYPEHEFSFLTLCNRGDANPADLNSQMADLFLQDNFEAFLSPYGGIYRNSELPIDYDLTVEEGKLKLNRRNPPKGFMTEDEKDIWRAGSWEFVFEREGNGDIKGFVVSTGRATDVEFTKVE
ncbi:MAG: serine hydrolase [Balneolaceae bacterium]